MQRVYIRRNGKDILLTEQEMWEVYRTCKEFEEEYLNDHKDGD